MSSTTGDAIHVEGLALSAHVGVAESERAQPQRITISFTLWPVADFSALADDVAQTVNYATVCEQVREIVASRRDKLIETLAGAIADALLARFPLRAVRVELRKFVIPDTDYVAVSVIRGRAEA